MEKKTYTAPVLELIRLDNEISLALASAPPFGPEEGSNSLQNSSLQNPYKTFNA